MVLSGPARLEGLLWAAAGLVRPKCTGAVALPERCRAGSPATHHPRQFEEEPRMKNKGGFLADARAPVLVPAISPALQLQELMVRTVFGKVRYGTIQLSPEVRDLSK